MVINELDRLSRSHRVQHCAERVGLRPDWGDFHKVAGVACRYVLQGVKEAEGAVRDCKTDIFP